jgi:hypothetical protein
MTRPTMASLAVLVASLAGPAPAAAHRLDEYLQATRVSIDVDRISLDIDLTPGASVAERVFEAVDSDRDGVVSEREASAYARRVLGAIALSVDDRPAPVTLTGRRFPTLREMRGGVGTIHLSATAAVPPATGPHHVSYDNAFSPDFSVFLANVLVPSDDRVRIGGQRRDFRQRTFAVEYRVTQTKQTRRRIGWLVAAFVVIGALVIARRATFPRGSADPPAHP